MLLVLGLPGNILKDALGARFQTPPGAGDLDGKLLEANGPVRLAMTSLLAAVKAVRVALEDFEDVFELLFVGETVVEDVERHSRRDGDSAMIFHVEIIPREIAAALGFVLAVALHLARAFTFGLLIRERE